MKKGLGDAENIAAENITAVTAAAVIGRRLPREIRAGGEAETKTRRTFRQALLHFSFLIFAFCFLICSSLSSLWGTKDREG